ncbi:MAG TPA: SDR family oxidoreductase, partial [Longimicrobium sp.]|nr:SDR family oxidoreductase [Longimicrobium sp.]
FRRGTDKRGYCALGSVKTNVGHLDAAAGVAGLIKTVQALRHRELPPSLHFSSPNPKIDFARSPFFVNAALRPWERRNGTPLRAGVSAFGMGGTNAHAVLEEAPAPPPASPARPWQLLALSARTASALEAATDRLAAHLRGHPELALADVAFTLREGRRAHAHRRTLAVRAGEDAAALLAARAPGRMADGVAAGRPSIAFLFPGLGDHYPGMGRGLYDAEPVYRAEVDRCAALLLPHLGFDLRDVLFPPDAPSADAASTNGGADGTGAANGKPDLRRMLGRGAETDAAGERLNRTDAAQPAVFVTGWALAKLWEHRGIRPEAVIGHSLGEYVAACVAGVFTLPDALELVAARARWIQALPSGAMLAVSLSPAQVLPLLAPGTSIAAVNAPETCVVAGPADAVEAVRLRVAQAGAVARLLPTTHAFHTPMMAPVAERLMALLARMALRPPAIPLLSNVTGTWLADDEARDPAYWARHLCETVQFDAGVETLLREPGRVLVEVGPGQTLGTFVRQRPRDATRPVPPIVPSLRHAYEAAADEAVHLSALGRLWAAGAEPDWRVLRQGERRRRVPLPTYPFERTRLWVDPSPRHPAPAAPGAAGGLVKEPDLRDWFHLASWRRTLGPPPAAGPDTRQGWLVLADEEGVGKAVAARLAELGQRVAMVLPGEAFARGPEGWAVRPGEPDDFRALFAALARDGQAPHHVLHFWALPAAPEEAPDAALARWGERGWHSLRALAAALDAEGGLRPVRVQVVASETAKVESGDRVVPEKALLLGALKVMGQEEGRLACRSVDVGAAEPGTAAWERRTGRILDELLSAAAEPAAAWRGALRYAQGWEPAPIAGDAPPTRGPRENGVYLVTGGLGRVGMLLAGWLARGVRARLVLTRRTPFPPPGEWDAWLAGHPDGDGTSRRIRAIRQMEAAGAEVRVAAVDVADEAAMRAVVEDARLRWGRLDGVIHAAGVLDGPSLDRRLATLTRGDAEAQFRAKVVGTRVLERVVPPETEVVLLVSSMSAVLGGFGFGGYAAANTFLDALAAARDGAGGTAWLSAGWDDWPDVLSPDEAAAGGRAPAGLSMTVPEALEAFRRSWACATAPHLAVAVGALRARLERWVSAPAAEPAAADDGDTPRSPRALLGIEEPYVAPRTALERELEQLWGQLLGVAEIGVHDDFFRLGGHSLLGTRLIGRVRQEMGAELPIQALFRAPTVAKMAAEVAELRLRDADPALLAGLLDEVRDLDPAQVRALLEAGDDGPAAAAEGA